MSEPGDPRPRPGRALRAPRPRGRGPLGLRDQRVRAGQVPAHARLPAGADRAHARARLLGRRLHRDAGAALRPPASPSTSARPRWSGPAPASATPTNVELLRRRLPEEMPAGPFDTIVCAEVLYYWSAELVRDGLRRIEAALAPGGTLLAVHWRVADPRRELTGDDVHEILDAATSLPLDASRTDARVPARPLAGPMSGAGGERIVIVGGGPAAQAAASAYREAGGAGPVTILAREADPPYERPPLTKDFLRGESGRDALPLVDRRWYAEHSDRPADRGRGDGDRPRRRRGAAPPTARSSPSTGCCWRPAPSRSSRRSPAPTAPACRRCGGSATPNGSAGSAPATAVLVVGSGFIGCEAAASLAMRGAAVTMATLEAAPQVERLGAEVAAEIAGWLEAAGVEILPEAELRLAAAGRRPRDPRRLHRRPRARRRPRRPGARGRAQRRPRRGGRDRGRRRRPGQRRDGVGRPADPRRRRRRLRLQPDRRPPPAGRTLGRGAEHGRGRRARRWPGSRPAGTVAPGFWSTIGERTIKYVGWGDGWDAKRFEPGDEGAFACWYGREGELVGVAAHRDDAAYERGRELIEERAPWS